MEIGNPPPPPPRSNQPNLPPGFRFHPTDEELVVQYLKKKIDKAPLPVDIVAEIELYKFDPWELPDKAVFGEQEWYFFSPRDRKYPNGARPNRAATSGYWKATGTDKPVVTASGGQKIGVKKVLVFYEGKPPKGVKTNWIMHEYRLPDHNKSPAACDFGKRNSLRLDDWVLCRIYKRHTTSRPMDNEKEDSLSMDHHHHDMPPPSLSLPTNPNMHNQTRNYGLYLHSSPMFEGFINNEVDAYNANIGSSMSLQLGSKTELRWGVAEEQDEYQCHGQPSSSSANGVNVTPPLQQHQGMIGNLEGGMYWPPFVNYKAS